MESCAATLQHILDLSAVRANVINQYGKENWWGLPEDVRKQYPPILLVCDEIAQWAAPLTVPPGLSKDNPTRIKAEYEKGIRAMNYMALLKICQTVRFSGIFFLYAAQSATSQNGLGNEDQLAKAFEDEQRRAANWGQHSELAVGWYVADQEWPERGLRELASEISGMVSQRPGGRARWRLASR